MSDTHATPSEKTANLMSLHRELAELAARPANPQTAHPRIALQRLAALCW